MNCVIIVIRTRVRTYVDACMYWCLGMCSWCLAGFTAHVKALQTSGYLFGRQIDEFTKTP